MHLADFFLQTCVSFNVFVKSFFQEFATLVMSYNILQVLPKRLSRSTCSSYRGRLAPRPHHFSTTSQAKQTQDVYIISAARTPTGKASYHRVWHTHPLLTMLVVQRLPIHGPRSSAWRNGHQIRPCEIRRAVLKDHRRLHGQCSTRWRWSSACSSSSDSRWSEPYS